MNFTRKTLKGILNYFGLNDQKICSINLFLSHFSTHHFLSHEKRNGDTKEDGGIFFLFTDQTQNIPYHDVAMTGHAIVY